MIKSYNDMRCDIVVDSEHPEDVWVEFPRSSGLVGIAQPIRYTRAQFLKLVNLFNMVTGELP